MPHSYSSFNTYKTCGLKYKFYYVDRLPAAPQSSPAMVRGSMIHNSFEQFIKGIISALPKEMDFYTQWATSLKNTEGVKPELMVSLDSEWTPTDWENSYLRGIFDIYTPPKNGKLEIFELKTGRAYPEHADQRALYGLFGLVLEPAVDTVTITGVYVDGRRTEQSVFHRSMLESMKAGWKYHLTNMEDPDTYIPNPGYHCKFCPYSKANGGPCAY